MNIANLEEASDKIDEYELRKRSRHVQKYKERAWAKWISEYLKALCMQHNLQHKLHDIQISKGDVVLIKGDEKNRGKWNIGILQQLSTKGKMEILVYSSCYVKRQILERAIKLLERAIPNGIDMFKL